jgi:hypothetical protein
MHLKKLFPNNFLLNFGYSKITFLGELRYVYIFEIFVKRRFFIPKTAVFCEREKFVAPIKPNQTRHENRCRRAWILDLDFLKYFCAGQA